MFTSWNRRAQYIAQTLIDSGEIRIVDNVDKVQLLRTVGSWSVPQSKYFVRSSLMEQKASLRAELPGTALTYLISTFLVSPIQTTSQQSVSSL